MKEELLSLLDELEGQRILVLGDVVADIYLQGSISRISREAPVLVLEQQKEVIVAGGAANVVNNVATLGGSVFAVGLLGHDSGGEGLKEVLRKNGNRSLQNSRQTAKTNTVAVSKTCAASSHVRRLQGTANSRINQFKQSVDQFAVIKQINNNINKEFAKILNV